ncbi:MAG: hypothetical protein RL375_2573 [Pseudomonadota bacterium]
MVKNIGDRIIPWGCVYKITFPNNKIYIGSDTAQTARIDYFKYFGTPTKSRHDMLRDLGEYIEHRKPYVLRKEILFACENVSVREVLKAEHALIREFNARDPNIGYNR